MTEALKRLNILDDKKVIELLESEGVAIIDDIYDKKTMAGLRDEMYTILESKKNIKGVRHIDYSIGVGKKVLRTEVNRNEFPVIYEIFSDKRLEKISSNYFKDDFVLNHEIYVIKDIVGSNHYAHDLHFDVVPTLKFFIYISNVNELNGAMECVPGSHKETRIIRQQYDGKINYENRRLTRNLPVERFSSPEKIMGEEGTLVIFNSDIWHKAGTVSQGERLVMRGHTRRATV